MYDINNSNKSHTEIEFARRYNKNERIGLNHPATKHRMAESIGVLLVIEHSEE